MLKSFLQNATVQRVLRSFLYACGMATFACVVLAMTTPDTTWPNYVAVGIIIGVFSFLSWLWLPIAVGITMVTVATVIYGAVNGEAVGWAGVFVLVPSGGIPILLALWRFLRPQQASLST